MKKFVAVAAAIAAFSFANSANAADMPVRAPAAVAPYYSAPYNWGGWYLGGNIGYGWGVSSDPDVTFVDGSGIGVPGFFAAGGNVTPNLQPKGVIGGLQLGYNWMVGPNWVVGLVTDFQFSDVKASGTNTVQPAGFLASSQSNSLETDWFGTVRAKTGWAQNNWLAYLTGGLAYGHVKSSGSNVIPGAGLSFAGSNDTTQFGWAAGAGVDYAVTRNWTIGLEYLYVDLGHVSYTETSTNGAATATTFTVDNRDAMHIGRITLNYKF